MTKYKDLLRGIESLKKEADDLIMTARDKVYKN